MRKPVFPGWFNQHHPPLKPYKVPSPTIVKNIKRSEYSIDDGMSFADIIEHCNLQDVPLHCIFVDVEYGYGDSDKYYISVGEEHPNVLYKKELEKYHKDVAEWEERNRKWPELKEKHDAYNAYLTKQAKEAKELAEYERLKAKYENASSPTN